VSRISWKESLRPLPSDAPQCRVYDVYNDFDFRIPRTSVLPLSNQEIVTVPDRRNGRVLNRAGLMLAAVGLQSRSELAGFLNDDSFSVGLYCAVEDGPEDYEIAKEMVQTEPENFARTYKHLRSSKQFLRQIANIQSSMLGIFLGIMGPQYVFSHSRWGCLQALEQAEFDLHNGVVRAALVCTAFSLEDALLNMRVRREIPESAVLCEGAAALVLLPNGEYTNWRCQAPSHTNLFYGIAHDLVLLAVKEEERKDEDDCGSEIPCGIKVSSLPGIASGPAPP
jgi:hypothetical protein